MIDQRPDRLPAQPPTVSPPPAFADRRLAQRRSEDRIAHKERILLARALDVLASDSSAEERLAGLLRLLARTVGAQRAAVVADGIERRAAVAVDPDEDPAAAEALAAWLDVHAPRTRARRAASGPAPISFIIAAVPGAADGSDFASAIDQPLAVLSVNSEAVPDPGSDATAAAGDELFVTAHYAVLPIPSAGEVALGFEFRRAADAGRLAGRLPPTLARHAAVALSLVTSQLATERELAALRARDTERSTFVSTVAHELRTPLTGLRGYLELILGGQVDDPSVERDFLERSRSIVGSMGELVGDLLELSKLESGTLDLEIEPFSIAEAGGHVATALLPIAIQRGINLTTSLPPKMRVAVGDRRRVEQIVTNLAANALKFTPSGGNVELEARVDGLVAIVIVRDDGAGIAAEDQARIFERFHRLAGHDRITGTGLGLPIARDLAQRMDGDLGVASVTDAGSAFVLALPGPADVSPTSIAAALRRALDDEEVRFEERLVRRAMASAATPGQRPATAEPLGSATGRSGENRLRALPPLRPEATTRA
ncbi:MAG: two-component system, OmpR family, phosphate regulon sensor histidine kinase PhoR [Chloroflexota bacterium]|nr:two-component system, OmpR family, phosphate regulon sensor histidine kinase PhoR [Chloroflexota bacterium]